MKKTLTKLEIRRVALYKKAYDKARYDFLKWLGVKNKKEYTTAMIRALKNEEELSEKDAAEKAEKIWRFNVLKVKLVENLFKLKA